MSVFISDNYIEHMIKLCVQIIFSAKRTIISFKCWFIYYKRLWVVTYKSLKAKENNNNNNALLALTTKRHIYMASDKLQ